ncbi:MAG: DNA topoisomerase (ATP-hydrolyzing) subunit B [Eubacteriales bacterium]|nr:DNA topoisomerase (ATP-hydrolyzing) subunit B [Eubacteriales bacterium]
MPEEIIHDINTEDEAIEEEIKEIIQVDSDTSYGAEDIQILEGLEAVRRRPGMYIGSTDERGLHHLVTEIVDNSIDEALAGYCKVVDVTLHADKSVTVVDDGRGIPVAIHPKVNLPTVQVVLTILHAGGKFGGGGYKVSGGLHGVGSTVVNALSEWLTVTVDTDGKRYFQRYTRGVPDTELQCLGPIDRRGTAITFKADPEIFETLDYNYDILRSRLREMAFLNKGITINLTDERGAEPRTDRFLFEGGIRSFVKYLNRNKVAVFPEPLYFEGVRDGNMVEIAMQYNDDYSESIYSYANNINTHEGGTHLDGFKTALTRVVNDYARKYNLLKPSDDNLSGEDVREGLTAVISVKLTEPQFEGQTKTKLGNSEMRASVSAVLAQGFGDFLEENPQVSRVLIEKCTTAARAREAARKARELTRRKNVFESGGLPGKLADCSSNDASKCEIFIVEGDSAGGSAKQGRNREYQAILPLRGKILNVEKTRADRALANNEIRAMITAFGCGFGQDFNAEKLRYHKIICMTDADVDGSHIRTLLLTFFYRYMKPLIEQGYVYIAQPPLYKVTKNKKIHYCYNDDELNVYLAEIGNQGVEIQRYKGLGEMSEEQLYETTMDPERRTLLRVSMQDAVEADEIFTILMGDEVEPRREFIENNAKLVADEDLDV